MDRKTYMEQIYSKYWINAREKIYGFPVYDHNLCEYITKAKSAPAKLLEVAIGTGYPFADFLQKEGYEVHGIDISSDLVNKCLEINPAINAKVGDAENLEYPDCFFDCVYCFHSTWYFPDLDKATREMIRVTKKGGRILFDIQNRDNEEIERQYRKRKFRTKGIGLIIKFGLNIIKIILQKGTTDWSKEVHEVPTFPGSVYENLKKNQIESYSVMVRDGNQSLVLKSPEDDLRKFERIIVCVVK